MLKSNRIESAQLSSRKMLNLHTHKIYKTLTYIAIHKLHTYNLVGGKIFGIDEGMLIPINLYLLSEG